MVKIVNVTKKKEERQNQLEKQAELMDTFFGSEEREIEKWGDRYVNLKDSNSRYLMTLKEGIKTGYVLEVRYFNQSHVEEFTDEKLNSFGEEFERNYHKSVEIQKDLTLYNPIE